MERTLDVFLSNPLPCLESILENIIQPKSTRDGDVTIHIDSSEATEDRSQQELKIRDDA